MKGFTILTLFILTIPACSTKSKKEMELNEVLNKKLNLTSFSLAHKKNEIIPMDELYMNTKYISIQFLQENCNSCYLKFIEWQNKMDSIYTPDDYTVLFVIKGESYGDFMTKVLDIEYVDNKFYTIMDTEGKFLKNNKDIPRWIIDSSVLIDGENKIKMVGAPFATPEMTELFHEICAK